jgi:hypothetical protein
MGSLSLGWTARVGLGFRRKAGSSLLIARSQERSDDRATTDLPSQPEAGRMYVPDHGGRVVF